MRLPVGALSTTRVRQVKASLRLAADSLALAAARPWQETSSDAGTPPEKKEMASFVLANGSRAGGG